MRRGDPALRAARRPASGLRLHASRSHGAD